MSILLSEADERWFEHTAPSGILAPGSDPVDGIYSGLDPDEFVGPDNAGYLDGKRDEGAYYKLSAEGTVSTWAQEFADSECKASPNVVHYSSCMLIEIDLSKMAHRLQPHWKTPLIFKRQLYRANVPNATKTTTGVHYDQIFLRGGPPTALTAWLPIGDCTPAQGGLMYLEDSKSLGQELELEFTEKARESGFTRDEAMNAFNQNVSPSCIIATDGR